MLETYDIYRVYLMLTHPTWQEEKKYGSLIANYFIFSVMNDHCITLCLLKLTLCLHIIIDSHTHIITLSSLLTINTMFLFLNYTENKMIEWKAWSVKSMCLHSTYSKDISLILHGVPLLMRI